MNKDNKRIIIKYKNRKLYDTWEKCYVNFGEIEEILIKGAEVLVIERDTGNDITGTILMNVLHNREARINNSNKHILTDILRRKNITSCRYIDEISNQ